MTFFKHMPRASRLQRSELAVPATSEQFFAKAAATAADVIFLDLEDAVAPARKIDAREAAIKALNELDWNGKTMAVRVNGLDTDWGQRDIIEIASRCSRLDLVLVPKVGTAFDVAFVDALLMGLEREYPREQRLGLEILVESTLGVANVEQIAVASDRLEAIIFGIGDYSVDLGTASEEIGASDPRYVVLSPPEDGRRPHWNDQYHFALARIANACRAHGIRAIDGPYANFGDPIGYTQMAKRAAALGYEGKWAIHPSQVDLANSVFSPSEAEILAAQRLIDDLAKAAAEGQGAIGRGGILLDMASSKTAQTILGRAALIDRASPGASIRNVSA